MKNFVPISLALCFFFFSSCKTVSEVREEQAGENAKLRAALSEAKKETVDLGQTQQELRQEIAALNNQIEQTQQKSQLENQLLKEELEKMSQRLVLLEKTKEEPAPAAPVAEAPKENNAQDFNLARQLFDQKKYTESIETLKTWIPENKTSADTKNAYFLLAEAYYANKDFALSALEYSEFKKKYPKDALVPRATFRQGQCFRDLGKKKEAKLFFEEVVEKHAKNPLSAQAKKEIAKLK